jgi:hypothetical protein
VASDIKWGIGGEKAGDVGASTEELEAGRRRVTCTEKNQLKGEDPYCSRVSNTDSEPSPSHRSAQLTLASSAASRRSNLAIACR